LAAIEVVLTEPGTSARFEFKTSVKITFVASVVPFSVGQRIARIHTLLPLTSVLKVEVLLTTAISAITADAMLADV
jgi:hypothetical protein